jgi:hypothetical protein
MSAAREANRPSEGPKGVVAARLREADHSLGHFAAAAEADA